MRTGISALKRALAVHIGNQSLAARACGVTPQAISLAIRKNKRVPAEWCIPIEKLTQGKVTRSDLRPDLWPKEEVGA